MMKKREFGPDAVRVFALFLLLWLHYWLRNGFYYECADDLPALIAVACRPLFMCCVPLFMVLTGYLKCGKPFEKNYYRSLLPILISYLIISLIFVFDRVFYWGESYSLHDWLVLFFDYKLANYGWYIEMYIGVFLLSPFLNGMWLSLKDQKERSCLVLTFAGLTFLPVFVADLFKWTGLAGIHPFPDYWDSLYFLTYYLIGCYIRSYQPKGKKTSLAAFCLLLMGIQTVLNVITREKEAEFSSGFAAGYGNLFIALMTICIFLIFYDLNLKNHLIRKITALISGITLEIYLCSRLFDPIIYEIGKGTYGPESYFVRGIAATSLVFGLTFLVAWPVHALSKYISNKIWP